MVTAATERAAATLGVSALAARRSELVVLVVGGEADGELLYDTIARKVSNFRGSIGLGWVASSPQELGPSTRPRGHWTFAADHAGRRCYTSFDDLGIYRVRSTGPDSEVGPLISQWLGELLSHDTKRRSNLVETQAEYLDCGGNYDQSAELLRIHRSTLRYRVRRIRELTLLDLTKRRHPPQPAHRHAGLASTRRGVKFRRRRDRMRRVCRQPRIRRPPGVGQLVPARADLRT
jgi:hypothetical protein